MAAQPQPSRVAIVTGAGGGIGRAIAVALAQQQWQLVLTDRDTDALADIKQACSSLTNAVDIIAADVTNEEEVAEVVRQTHLRHGRLDGFVSNAGIPGVLQAVRDYPTATFQQVMNVNVLGTFLCMKHGLAAMKETGSGSFVVVGSTSSIRGRANLAAYVASKHAVLGLMRTAALEQVGTAVRVNAVLPGPTQTAMIDTINNMAAKLASAGTVQRAVAAPYGEPQDVANAVAFLLSAEARHMNGSALVIDGGSTLA